MKFKKLTGFIPSSGFFSLNILAHFLHRSYSKHHKNDKNDKTTKLFVHKFAPYMILIVCDVIFYLLKMVIWALAFLVP
jgi:hypothetical protein